MRDRVWILPLIALSGMVSFTYEVMWSRLLGQVLGGSVYAFATMLASFLGGIAIGSAAAIRFTRTKEEAARAFGWAQIAIAVLSYGAFQALDALPAIVSAIGRTGNLRLLANAAAAAMILLPSTVAIGATSGVLSQPGSWALAWAKISRAKPHQLTAGAPQ